ncbi:MAG: glycosyltransferase family 9 protein [Kiritimatiellae bacterium]|nr:glycosyltransferase family 9 protein [Kiritimatiellia bacterium]
MAQAQSILVVKLSSLGDLFHALPAVHNLKVGLGAEIDWVTQREYAGLVSCFDDVRRVIPFDRRGRSRKPRAFLKELRAERYDMVLDMQGLLKSGVITRLARAGRRLGPSFQRECAWLFYHAVAGKRDKERHAVEENFDVVRFLGLDPIPPEFPVTFPAIELEGIGPRVAVIPSSRWVTKDWTPAGFAAAARHLRDERGAIVYLMGGPGDAARCADIDRMMGDGTVNLAGKTSLVEMGSYLAAMDLLIANDSGPVHMAAAVGTPSLVLFGPTCPDRTGPYGDDHRIVQSGPLECRPCFMRDCPPGHHRCMADISADQVTTVALEMLKKGRG